MNTTTVIVLAIVLFAWSIFSERLAASNWRPARVRRGERAAGQLDLGIVSVHVENSTPCR
jgi:hypothetical protein